MSRSLGRRRLDTRARGTYGVVTTLGLIGLSLPIGSARADEPAVTVSVRGGKRTDRGTTVQTLDAGTMEKLGATTAADALERLPATSVGTDSRGERLVASRGFDQRQLSVLLDGVPLTIPYDGQLDLGKLPVDMLDRVTLVKGASSLLYGPNGLGGAIVVTTRTPSPQPSVRALTEASLGLSTRTNVALGGGVGRASVLVGGAYESIRRVPLPASFEPTANEPAIDGTRTNADRLSGTQMVKVSLELGESQTLSVSAFRFGGSYGVAPAARSFFVRYWRWSDYSATLGAITHRYTSGTFASEVVAYTSLFSNTLDAFDDGGYRSQRLPKAFHSVYDDRTIGVVAKTTYQSGPFALRTWSGLRNEHHSGRADRNVNTIAVSTNLATTSVQGELTSRAARTSGSLGVQLDGESPDAPPFGPSPRAAVGVGPMASATFAPHAVVSMTASAAGRTRFPTLRERFSTVFGDREPNAELAPERAENLSFDVVLTPTRTTRVAIGVYRSTLRDLVAPVLVRPQVQQQQNVGRGRFFGGEVEASVAPSGWIELAGGLALLDSAREDAGPLVYRPGLKALVRATVRPHPMVALTGVGRYVGAQRFLDPDTGDPGTLGGYGLFDAHAEWQFRRGLRAFLRGQNLADASVESRVGFPEPGRRIFLGFAASLSP